MSAFNDRISEAEVRALRDAVFEVPSGDSNWFAAKEYWLRPDWIAWLRLESEKLKVENGKHEHRLGR